MVCLLSGLGCGGIVHGAWVEFVAAGQQPRYGRSLVRGTESGAEFSAGDDCGLVSIDLMRSVWAALSCRLPNAVTQNGNVFEQSGLFTVADADKSFPKCFLIPSG